MPESVVTIDRNTHHAHLREQFLSCSAFKPISNDYTPYDAARTH